MKDKPDKSRELSARPGRFQQFGLIMFGIFYLVSVIMVILNQSKEEILDPNCKTITIAHWQLEDGFREGIDEAIREFEKIKAVQGQKVKVIQSTIPVRGYQQWVLTQLIGGKPADLIELSGGSHLFNQYFRSLSNYVNKPNPFNRGTVLDGVPWKDTFIDGMVNALDYIYAEHFGVGVCFHTMRMFVNMELLEKATGSRKLPRNLSEWLEDCRKVKEYGRKIGKPLIPIGVRGFDKATLSQLFRNYLAQLNGIINDRQNLTGAPGATESDVLEGLINGEISLERYLAVVNIIKDLGQYFGKGFTATDLEQTKFLFFSGKVCFFPDGTWNAYSMIKNTPFDVEVMTVPGIGKNHPYSKYFTGTLSEQGIGVGCKFGIPKACQNFNLTLEFLQFLTSFKTNQMVMGHCKWPPAVRKAKYEGLLAKFKPVETGDQQRVANPLFYSRGTRSKMLEDLEEIIITQPGDAEALFWENYQGRLERISADIVEAGKGIERNLLEGERQRSQIKLGLLRKNLSPEARKSLEFRRSVILESYPGNQELRNRQKRRLELTRRQIKERDKKGTE